MLKRLKDLQKTHCAMCNQESVCLTLHVQAPGFPDDENDPNALYAKICKRCFDHPQDVEGLAKNIAKFLNAELGTETTVTTFLISRPS